MKVTEYSIYPYWIKSPTIEVGIFREVHPDNLPRITRKCLPVSSNALSSVDILGTETHLPIISRFDGSLYRRSQSAYMCSTRHNSLNLFKFIAYSIDYRWPDTRWVTNKIPLWFPNDTTKTSVYKHWQPSHTMGRKWSRFWSVYIKANPTTTVQNRCTIDRGRQDKGPKLANTNRGLWLHEDTSSYVKRFDKEPGDSKSLNTTKVTGGFGIWTFDILEVAGTKLFF